MSKAFIRLTVVLAAVVSFLCAKQLPQTTAPSPHRDLLNRYCVTCHNDKLKTAGLTLENLDTNQIGLNAPVWEKVLRKLRTSSMPPVGMPRPDNRLYDSFTKYLDNELDRAALAKPNPGRIPVHRLNRTEYANSVRDLLAIDIDPDSFFPADDLTFGFDNIGDVLSLSPSLLERYVSAADKISRMAVVDPAIPPSLEVHTIPSDAAQDDRTSENLPFGSRGGAAVLHSFPLNTEYIIQVRLKRTDDGEIIEINRPQKLDVFLDGKRLHRFVIGGDRKGLPGDTEQEKYVRTADEGLEVRLPMEAGDHQIGATFLRQVIKPEGVVSGFGGRRGGTFFFRRH